MALVDARAERITPSDHAQTRDRLEATVVNLRSPGPPERFDPTRFKGLGSLQAALSNLQAQERIGSILILVEGRREAAERAAALREIEAGREDGPRVFDVFSAGDLSHLLYFYNQFHPRINQILEGSAMEAGKVRNLGSVMHEKLSPVRAEAVSASLLRERNEQAVTKMQGWLDDPNLHATMEKLIPSTNENSEEDTWDFMDSLATLNSRLGDRGGNLKMFFDEHAKEAAVKLAYPFDIRNAKWAEEPPAPPKQDDPPDLGHGSEGKAELYTAIPLLSIAGLQVPPVDRRIKAVEQRRLDIRDVLGVYLDDIMTRAGLGSFASGVTVNNAFRSLKSTVIDDLREKRYLDLPVDRDYHPRFDAAAVATALYLLEHGDGLTPKQRRQVQGIAGEVWTRKQTGKEKGESSSDGREIISIEESEILTAIEERSQIFDHRYYDEAHERWVPNPERVRNPRIPGVDQSRDSLDGFEGVRLVDLYRLNPLDLVVVRNRVAAYTLLREEGDRITAWRNIADGGLTAGMDAVGSIVNKPGEETQRLYPGALIVDRFEGMGVNFIMPYFAYDAGSPLQVSFPRTPLVDNVAGIWVKRNQDMQ